MEEINEEAELVKNYIHNSSNQIEFWKKSSFMKKIIKRIGKVEKQGIIIESKNKND